MLYMVFVVYCGNKLKTRVLRHTLVVISEMHEVWFISLLSWNGSHIMLSPSHGKHRTRTESESCDGGTPVCLQHDHISYKSISKTLCHSPCFVCSGCLWWFFYFKCIFLLLQLKMGYDILHMESYLMNMYRLTKRLYLTLTSSRHFLVYERVCISIKESTKITHLAAPSAAAKSYNHVISLNGSKRHFRPHSDCPIFEALAQSVRRGRV
jgi:hypothetical protein